MKRALLLAVLLAVLALVGCKGACTNRHLPIDVSSADPPSLRAFYQNMVDTAQTHGWKCDASTLRNAFGAAIGTHYDCTRCD